VCGKGRAGGQGEVVDGACSTEPSTWDDAAQCSRTHPVYETALRLPTQIHHPPAPPTHTHPNDKVALLSALEMVDEVVVGEDRDTGLDFRSHFLRLKPHILAVTEDDKYGAVKRELCAAVGAKYTVLPKDLPVNFTPVSTTQIRANIRTPAECPLRVDFGGGWLDVPKHARAGAVIVNCAVSPLVSLNDWRYHVGGGLGGSAAHALLQGRDPVASELDLGVGWQDPAVIRETGLCVWRSGPRPALDFKTTGGFLRGRMALLWTGRVHCTPEKTDVERDYDLVQRAGAAARAAVLPGTESLKALAAAVELSYLVQLGEGMEALARHGALARKYCGGGWGGYALYMFGGEDERAVFLERVADTSSIEPYVSQHAG